MAEEAWILATESRINPSCPLDNRWHDEDSVLHLFASKSGRVTKAASSAGSMEWPLGTTVTLYADQTGRRMGEYTFVGYVHENGRSEGTIPNVTVAHYVFK